MNPRVKVQNIKKPRRCGGALEKNFLILESKPCGESMHRIKSSETNPGIIDT